MELVYLYALLLLVLIAILLYFFFGTFWIGAGYQPTPAGAAERMMVLGAIGPGDRVYDLGAGTGALLVRAAQRGATVTGYEAEPLRFLFLLLRRAFSPTPERILLRRSNFFEANLSDATVVLAFLWPGAMDRLRSKFQSELKPGTRIVSYWHPLPGWEPAQADPGQRVYLYIR